MDMRNTKINCFVAENGYRFSEALISVDDLSLQIEFSSRVPDFSTAFCFSDFDAITLNKYVLSKEIDSPNYLGSSKFNNKNDANEYMKLLSSSERTVLICVGDLFRAICFNENDLKLASLIEHVMENSNQCQLESIERIEPLCLRIGNSFDVGLHNFFLLNAKLVSALLYDNSRMFVVEKSICVLAASRRFKRCIPLFSEDSIDCSYQISAMEEQFVSEIAEMSMILRNELKHEFDLSHGVYLVATWVLIVKIAIAAEGSSLISSCPSFFSDVEFYPIQNFVDKCAGISTIMLNHMDDRLRLLFAFLTKHQFPKWNEFVAFKNEFLKICEDSCNSHSKNHLRNILFSKTRFQKNLTTIEDVDSMDGHEFESFLAAMLSKLGYNTTLTKITGDQGIDIVAIKDGIKFGIQAKRYSSNVTNSAIQEAVAGKGFYDLDKVMVVTNSYFTKSAVQLATRNNVILWDRIVLRSKLDEMNRLF